MDAAPPTYSPHTDVWTRTHTSGAQRQGAIRQGIRLRTEYPNGSMASIPVIPQSQTHELLCFDQQECRSLLRSMVSKAIDELVVDIASMSSPQKLPKRFHFRGSPGMSALIEASKTDHGGWRTKNFVSIPNTFQGNSPNFPKFMGTKRTMEFKPTDGTKPTFGMTKYNLLCTNMEDRAALDLNEELSLCYVYPLEGKGKSIPNRNGKRSRAPDHCNDVVLPPLGEWKQEISKVDVTKYCPVGVDDYSVDVPDLPSKPPRLESKHWHNFTKIYTKDPELMYAACNHCNKMLKLKGGTSCGTSSLKSHTDACRPKQEQLPGNSSSLHVPSISLEGHHGITRDNVAEIRGGSIEFRSASVRIDCSSGGVI